jgi:hypothetical protein
MYLFLFRKKIWYQEVLRKVINRLNIFKNKKPTLSQGLEDVFVTIFV